VHADALAFLAASLTLPAGATEKVLIYCHDLYCSKFVFEESQNPRGDLQVEEVLETSTGPDSGIDDSRSSTVLYGILPNDPKEAAAIRRLLDSTTMRLHEHYIIDRMMESYSATFHTKRHMRHSGTLTVVCAELTNRIQARRPLRRLGYY